MRSNIRTVADDLQHIFKRNVIKAGLCLNVSGLERPVKPRRNHAYGVTSLDLFKASLNLALPELVYNTDIKLSNVKLFTSI